MYGCDVAAASIIRECTARGKGVKALDGVALWLDTPLIEMLHGEGTIAKRIPGMLRMYAKFGIDLRKEPILIYPTLHYQNGGILIDKDAETKLPGLFVAGEAVGGIHGTNRLMGNSLLDIIVFGRIAGTKAAEAAKSVKLGMYVAMLRKKRLPACRASCRRSCCRFILMAEM